MSSPKKQTKPACFHTLRQYQEWLNACRSTDVRVNYCADCTPLYQERMVSEKRCRYPRTEFKLDRDGFITGVRK